MNIEDRFNTIVDHSMIKILTPIVIATLIGAVSWMFSSVTSLQNQVILIQDGKVANIEEKLTTVQEDIDELMKIVTDMRIRYSFTRDR